MSIILKFYSHYKYSCPPYCKGCCICDGGLFICSVCGGAESSLPMDCPGIKMTKIQHNLVSIGKLNYSHRWGWMVS